MARSVLDSMSPRPGPGPPAGGEDGGARVAGRRGALVIGRRRREAADTRDERATQPEVLRGAVLLAVAPEELAQEVDLDGERRGAFFMLHLWGLDNMLSVPSGSTSASARHPWKLLKTLPIPAFYTFKPCMRRRAAFGKGLGHQVMLATDLLGNIHQPSP